MHKNRATAVIATPMVAFLISPAVAQTTAPATTPTRPLTIGAVCVASLAEAGWVQQHEAGCKAFEAARGGRTKTSDVENVAADADAACVTRDLASQGCRLIFMPSFGSGQSGARWGGVKMARVRVGSVGPKLAQKVADDVLARQNDIAGGGLHPFAASVYTTVNAGQLLLATGKTFSDAQILGMNGLVQSAPGQLSQ